MGILFYYLKKSIFLLALPKQISFFTISNKNMLFKTQGTRLSVIVALKIGLEKDLLAICLSFSFNSKMIGNDWK